MLIIYCCILLVTCLAADIVRYFIYIFFLQGEIGRRTAGDNVLEREGYAVSAGFSLGLLALGEHS